MGKKLSQLWRGNTKQVLWYAHFPFPYHSTIKNYRRKLIPHPISVITCNTLKSTIAQIMTNTIVKPEPENRDNFGLAADAVDIATFMDFNEGRIVGFPTDMTYSQFLEIQQAIDNIATH